MNEKEHKRSLDELITQSINAEKPEFDAEKWKQKFPEELQLLHSRRSRSDHNSFSWFRIAVPAVAAVIIVAVSFFAYRRPSIHEQHEPAISTTAVSPSEMLTAMSLTMAYQRGGIEAVDKQSREGYKLLGPRPKTPTLQQIIKELKLSQSERTEL